VVLSAASTRFQPLQQFGGPLAARPGWARSAINVRFCRPASSATPWCVPSCLCLARSRLRCRPRRRPVLVGVTIVAANVLKTSFRQAYVPRQILGRVIVGMQFLNYGTIPLGALTAGALATTLGLRPTLWLMTAGVGLAALSLLIGPLKHHRDFPTHPEHTAAS